MLAQLRTKTALGFRLVTDRRYREFYAQRKLLDIGTREEAADQLAAKLPQLPHNPESGEINALLARDGFVSLSGIVSPEQIVEIKAHFSNLPAYDPYRPRLGSFLAPHDVPSQTHVAHYSDHCIISAPHIFNIANNPKVLDAVGSFLGCKPTLAAIRVWWSTPSSDGVPEHAEKFHRDVDDLRFVKLFVYLTDVTEESGPHIFATGSHRKNVLNNIGRYTDEEVEAACGRETIHRFTGPAGTSFLENTYGLHRGLPPVTRPRMIFQPLYTQRPTIFGPRRPLRRYHIDEAGLDRYVNRLFLHD